jgi:hypothetical protein
MSRDTEIRDSDIDADSMGAFDGVVPRPAPTHRLSERRTQHDVYASDRSRRQR